MQEKMKRLKGLPKKIASFLEQEHFSQEEIFLLSHLFEKKVIEKEEDILQSKEKKIAITSLVEKGIVRQKKQGKSEIYFLDSIESFFAWTRKNANTKKDSIDEQTNAFLDLLRSFLGSAVKSKINFYEGIEGIKDSYRHILQHAEEVSAYFSVIESIQPDLHHFFENEYTPERARRKIFSRNITVKTPKTTYFKLKSEELFMEIRMVPIKFFPLINAEINLYGKYMHCMVFDESGGFAVILESDNIVRLHKALYEMTWESSKYFLEQELLNLHSSPTEKNHFWQNIYLTDNIETILENIDSRKEKFFPYMKDSWHQQVPTYVTTPEGEQILKICDLEVMSDFEDPYMKELAKIATTHGGKILNIGFGLGIVDSYIEERRATRKITEHHIIELNEKVFQQAEIWREQQSYKESIFLHQGDWEDVLPQLQKQGLFFNGVVYDGYPLEVDEICRDSIRFLYWLLKMKMVKEESGIITFYVDSVDGLGENFQKFVTALGVQEISTKKVSSPLPNRDCEYWKENFFLAPILTNIVYPS